MYRRRRGGMSGTWEKVNVKKVSLFRFNFMQTSGHQYKFCKQLEQATTNVAQERTVNDFKAKIHNYWKEQRYKSLYILYILYIYCIYCIYYILYILYLICYIILYMGLWYSGLHVCPSPRESVVRIPVGR